MYSDSIVQKIGQISLQHDWFEAFRSGSKTIWVSCSTEDEWKINDGVKGDKGDVGPPGAKGEKGDMGLRGPQGNKGDVGPPGPKGEKGDTGLVRPQGNKGDIGPPGAKGEKGDIGLRGLQGKRGPTGVKGERGLRCEQGLRGPKGKRTSYGEISSKVSGDGTKELNCSQGFEAHIISKYVLMVKNNAANITSYFFAPCSVFSNIHSKAVRCLDISAGGGLAVSCGDDQGLFVWQTDNGDIRRTLDGHINDVSQCRFFPSGIVVLSGGTDMRLKIWSVEDGTCPVTLVGHTAAITDTVIIERGKNIISCGRDGNALLWDCGTSKCLTKLQSCSSVINCCSISQYESQLGSIEVPNRSERESGTEGKLLLIGREDGYLDAIDVHSRKNVFSTTCYSAINGCCFINERNIAVGLQDGKVVYFDIRNTRMPTKIFKYGKSSVNCIQSFHGDSLLIGRGDGSCNCIRNNESSEFISMELSGSNCDPLFHVVSHENLVYTACRDSNVRKYRLLLQG